MENVKINVIDAQGFQVASALVPAEVHGTGITTGNPGCGSPNIHHYTVRVAGHELHGTWDYDARHPTQVDIQTDHPLAGAIRLRGAQRDALANLREMRGPRPAGWSAGDWYEACAEAKAQYARAKPPGYCHDPPSRTDA